MYMPFRERLNEGYRSLAEQIVVKAPLTSTCKAFHSAGESQEEPEKVEAKPHERKIERTCTGIFYSGALCNFSAQANGAVLRTQPPIVFQQSVRATIGYHRRGISPVHARV